MQHSLFGSDLLGVVMCTLNAESHHSATVCISTVAVQRDWSTKELLTVCAYLNRVTNCY